MRALQNLRGCVPTHNARCKPAVRANADTILQEDEWNRCEENPYKADEGRSPLYAHLRACQNKSGGGVERRVIEAHIVEHLCCEQSDTSPSSRPDHGIDSEGRRGIRSTRARLSLLMIKSPITYRNSQICVHKVVLKQKSRSACASESQVLVTYQERHGYHTCRRAEHDCA